MSYRPPELFSVNWSKPATTAGGAILEITGSNFGDDRKLVSVSVGSVPCDVTKLVRHQTLFCTVGAGFGIDLPLRVCVDSQCVDSGKGEGNSGTFSYDAPTVETISFLNNNTKATTEGGFTLVISGSNFGPLHSGSISLMRAYIYAPPFAEVSCGNLTMIRAHHELHCISPSGQGKDKRIRLETLASTTSTSTRRLMTISTMGFSYARPLLDRSSTLKLGPTSGGNSVVIRGQNFGSTASLVTVNIGGTGRCSNPSLHNDSHLFCTAEAGQGHSHLVKVTVSGQTTGAHHDLDVLLMASYDAPEILSVEPRTVEPGQTLLITGRLAPSYSHHACRALTVFTCRTQFRCSIAGA